MYKLKIFILCQRLLFLTILFLWGNQVLANKVSIVNLSSKENSIYLDLLKQADEINLYQDPYWQKLLHFYSFGESIGQWSSKSDVVSEDVNENELRMILNFGHTIGHAIEGYYNYKELLHGEAIFYGMKCALYLSNKYGNLSKNELINSLDLLSKFDLPSVNIQDYDKFMTYIKNDKKIRASNIKFILLDEIGKSQINNNISFEQIKESLKVL